MLDSVELGETAHKKTGTTVPESIHSFSKFHCCFCTGSETVLRSENFIMIQMQLYGMGQIQSLVSIKIAFVLKSHRVVSVENASRYALKMVFGKGTSNSSTKAFIIQMKS